MVSIYRDLVLYRDIINTSVVWLLLQMLALLLALLVTSSQLITGCVVNIGSDQSTQCEYGQYCSPTYYEGVDLSGDPMVARTCRPCDVSLGGGLPGSGVYDPLNLCNCGAGQICRQTAPTIADQPSVVGYCEPSAILTTACLTNDDCEGVRESSLDGGFSRRERGFCVNDFCAQCNLTAFIVAYGTDRHTCPGYMLQKTSSGVSIRRYLSARPGITFVCNPNGTLTEYGTVNLELMSGEEDESYPLSQPVPASSGNDREGEPDYVPGLLAVNFILTFCTLLIVICICVILLVWISKLKGIMRPRISEPPLRT